jgi:hypothetical protein
MPREPEVVSKQRFKQPIKNYTKVSNSLFNLYTRLPEFKADHALAYIILCNYYNEEYGYAFPTIWDITLKLNVGERKVTEIMKVLENVGLIEIRKVDGRRNNVYIPKAPIDNEEDFYSRFPHAKEHYEERINWCESRRTRPSSGDRDKERSKEKDDINDRNSDAYYDRIAALL